MSALTAAQETALVVSQSAGIPISPGINAPEDYDGPITPNDNTDLRFRCRVVWCGTGGNIAFQNLQGNTATMYNLPASQWVVLRTNRILATGTTAANILIGH